MKTTLVICLLFLSSISFSQDKLTRVTLNDVDTTSLVCLKSEAYYISLDKENLINELERLNVSGIGQLQLEDTLNLKEFQMSVFEEIQCNSLDKYLVRTIKTGKAQIFDMQENELLSEIDLKYMVAPGIGMEYFTFQTTDKNRICLFGIAEYQGCP